MMSQCSRQPLQWPSSSKAEQGSAKASSQAAQNSVPGLLAALKECVRTKDLKKGRQVHSQATASGLLSRTMINSLILMYAKCGSMVDARKLFDNSSFPDDVVSWTALITGYVQNDQSELALELFEKIQDGFCDSRLYVAALSACTALAAKKDGGRSGKRRWLDKGSEIHSRAVSDRCCDLFVENKLIDMYCKCKSMEQARSVFDRMASRNVVSWTALLQGYGENGENELALELFDKMKEEDGCNPNARTFLAALSACANLAAKESRDGKCGRSNLWLEKGKALHSRAVTNRSCTIFVESALVDLYSKCGCMDEARRVFDNMVNRDVVCWNALLQGYVDNDDHEAALQLFEAMERARGGAVPNARTFTVAILACAALGAKERQGMVEAETKSSRKWLEKGREVHQQAVTRKCLDFFLESTLVDMYAKCGSMKQARRVFDAMQRRDVVSWTALIMGYVENGENELSLEMINAMASAGVRLDSATYLAALMASANLMDVRSGRRFHAEICSQGFEQDSSVASSLVDFHGRCGSLDAAWEVFDSVRRKTTVTWTALMFGYSLRGDTERVFEAFQQMREEGVAANEVTLVCVLSACSHAGLTMRGKKYFSAMKDCFGIDPNIRHFNCMVDLLGRGGFVEEAVRMVESMPFEADVVTWTAVLDACRKWKNVGVGRRAYEALVRLDERDSTAYVLMRNVFKGGELETEAELRSLRRFVHGKASWVDEIGKVHKFVTANLLSNKLS